MHYFYLLFILVYTLARLFWTLRILEYLYAILGTTLFLATSKNSPTAR
jgi:hypothetical protein